MMKNRSLLDNSSEESYRSKSSHESDVRESRDKKIRPKRVPLLNIRKPKRYLTFIVQKKIQVSFANNSSQNYKVFI